MTEPVHGIDARFRLRLGGFSLDVAFSVPGHGITALFGRSGSGKTTLLRCIAGLAHAPDGRFEIHGECWQDSVRGVFLPTHRRSVGYVFQEASLFPHLSVRGNLEYGWTRAANAEQRVVFDKTVDLLGVAALLERNPGTLSGGERQRVAMTRALLTSPRLLLMDEPLSALDDASKAEILPYLERLHRELSVPALYVSHSLDEVIRVADYMVLMEHGSVCAQGLLLPMLTRLDLPLAHGDGAGAIIEATVVEHDVEFHLTTLAFDGGRLETARIDAALGARRRVRIQARDVSLAAAPPPQTSILNILPATVSEIVDDGPGKTIVRLAVGSATVLARITRKSATSMGIGPGSPVYAQIKSVALLD